MNGQIIREREISCCDQFISEIVLPLKVFPSSDSEPWLPPILPPDIDMLPFSQCEEAFLLRNVRNVIDVWASRSGQAKLNFSTRNGQAELQLFYQLGHPEASHLPHQPPPYPFNFPPSHTNPPHHSRRKSQRRILKDRKRAAEFQARRRAEASSAVSSSSQTTTVSTTVTTSTPSTAVSSTTRTSNTTTNQAVTSLLPSTINAAISISPITQQQAVPASCSTTPSLSAPIPSILPQAVTSLPDDRYERYTLDTMPLPTHPDCPTCFRNFDFPCYATPCLVCGLWFHNDCFGDHYCSISDSDDDSASETDNENMDTSNNVAFPAVDKQKVFAAP